MNILNLNIINVKLFKVDFEKLTIILFLYADLFVFQAKYLFLIDKNVIKICFAVTCLRLKKILHSLRHKRVKEILKF